MILHLVKQMVIVANLLHQLVIVFRQQKIVHAVTFRLIL